MSTTLSTRRALRRAAKKRQRALKKAGLSSPDDLFHAAVVAVSSGSVAEARRLFALAKDLLTDAQVHSVLVAACGSGRLPMVRLLVEELALPAQGPLSFRYDPSDTEPSWVFLQYNARVTPLGAAAACGSADVVEFLLRTGAADTVNNWEPRRVHLRAHECPAMCTVAVGDRLLCRHLPDAAPACMCRFVNPVDLAAWAEEHLPGTPAGLADRLRQWSLDVEQRRRLPDELDEDDLYGAAAFDGDGLVLARLKDSAETEARAAGFGTGRTFTHILRGAAVGTVSLPGRVERVFPALPEWLVTTADGGKQRRRAMGVSDAYAPGRCRVQASWSAPDGMFVRDSRGARVVALYNLQEMQFLALEDDMERIRIFLLGCAFTPARGDGKQQGVLAALRHSRFLRQRVCGCVALWAFGLHARPPLIAVHRERLVRFGGRFEEEI